MTSVCPGLCCPGPVSLSDHLSPHKVEPLTQGPGAAPPPSKALPPHPDPYPTSTPAPTVRTRTVLSSLPLPVWLTSVHMSSVSTGAVRWPLRLHGPACSPGPPGPGFAFPEALSARRTVHALRPLPRSIFTHVYTCVTCRSRCGFPAPEQLPAPSQLVSKAQLSLALQGPVLEHLPDGITQYALAFLCLAFFFHSYVCVINPICCVQQIFFHY